MNQMVLLLICGALLFLIQGKSTLFVGCIY